MENPESFVIIGFSMYIEAGQAVKPFFFHAQGNCEAVTPLSLHVEGNYIAGGLRMRRGVRIVINAKGRRIRRKLCHGAQDIL